MLYGPNFSTSKATVGKMCSYEKYKERIRARLALPSINEVDQSVRVALTSANNKTD
jgi:hypothetical protein